MQTLGPFNLVGLSILGLSLLIATRILYGRQGAAARDFLRHVLNILGWLLLVCGVVGVAFGLAHVAATIIVVIGLINVVLAARFFFRIERETVIPHLATAAERGIPLPVAARAYSMDRGDGGAARALILADLLERGVALPDALDESGHAFRLGPALAVGVGSDLGCLNRSLRMLNEANDTLVESIRSLNDRIVYLSWIVMWNCAILLFLSWRILPTIQKVLQEFGLTASPHVVWASDIAIYVSSHPLAPLFVGAVVLLLLAGLVFMLIFHLELWPRELPMLGWLTLRYDAAWVLRALSWGVAAERPIRDTLDSIQKRACRSHLRRRIRQALVALEQGRPWTHALQDVGLLRGGDAAVIDAAQRAGNLAWALEELADGQLRRLGYRLRLVTSILLPIVVILIGLLVFGIATAVLGPLFQLISSMA